MRNLFKLQPYFLAFYLLLIGISLGAIIASGVFSAPTIFRAASIAPNLDITLFQSGVLMTDIFIKLNLLLNALAFVILIYETLSFRVNGARFSPLLGLICVLLIFTFTFYHTPYIIEAQKLGEDGIANLAFDSVHEQSVWVFKALMVGLFLLFVVRVLGISSGYKGK